jgi:hypothetical protein
MEAAAVDAEDGGAPAAATRGRKRKLRCLGRPKNWTRPPPGVVQPPATAAERAAAQPCTRRKELCPNGCGYCVAHCSECSGSAKKRAAPEATRGGRSQDQADRRGSFEAAEAAAAQVQAQDASAARAFVFDEAADAPDDARVPLTNPNAKLEDVGARFGFSGQETRSLVKSGTAGGKHAVHSELDAGEKQRRYNALNSVFEPLAKIIDPREWPALARDWHAHRNSVTSAEQDSGCVTRAVALLMAVRPSSEAAVALSALLCKALGVSELKALCNKHILRATEKGRKLYDKIVGNGTLRSQRVPMPATKTRARTKPAVIQDLVTFTLDEENVQMLSWGKKRALTDAGVKPIPCVSRKISKGEMWRKYHERMKDKPNKARVKSSLFYKIVGSITGRQEKSVKAVDYRHERADPAAREDAAQAGKEEEEVAGGQRVLEQ